MTMHYQQKMASEPRALCGQPLRDDDKTTDTVSPRVMVTCQACIALSAGGVKLDAEKPMFDLVPPRALARMVDVLTYGAKKYAPDNWRKVPDRRRRYFAAAMRHLWAWWRGESVDAESGLPHLAHAACCVFFLLDEDP